MAITVHLPDAPAIAGLSFRPIRGEEDADALYAVHVGRMVRDEVDPLSTFKDFPSREHLHVSLSKAVAGGKI